MSQHLISTLAQRGTCPRCHAQLLTAIDAGIPTQVDAQPITTEQEIAALLEGKWTYLHKHQLLIHRDATVISGGRTGTIHAQHKCPNRNTDDFIRRQNETQKLRAELAEARAAGKAIRHAARLRRADQLATTEETR